MKPVHGNGDMGFCVWCATCGVGVVMSGCLVLGPEVYGNCNAPPAVTYSAILYALRCLVNRDIPLNQGCLAPVTVSLPEGSILCPSDDAGVCGGNTLTSQRVTDVVLCAFKAAAASQVCVELLLGFVWRSA